MAERRTLSEQEFNAVRDRVLSSLPKGLSEADFNRVIGPRMQQALAETEYQPATPEGGSVGRFVSNAAEMLNPISIVEGLYNTVAHPIDTATNIARQARDEARTAVDAAKQGEYGRAVGHGLAAALPIVGPAAANAGEQIANGDVAGGLGTAAGILAPFGVAPAVRAASSVAPARAAALAADALESGAASRVENVMAPKGSSAAIKRLSNKAGEVSPELLKRGDAGEWSREGMHANVKAGLADAEAQLDAAADARLNGRAFPTQPIIADLLKKRQQFVAEAVEGSRPVPAYEGKAVRGARVTNDASTEFKAGPDVSVNDIPLNERGYRDLKTGEFADEPRRAARPIGKDVEPAPNADRLAAIDKAIAEVRQLGPVARYESLRRIRQAWDGPAKIKYNPSTTADFLKNQGFASGAADVTGTLREHLAPMDPETAAANKNYTLYRAADDVMNATAEIEKAKPKVGRKIMARLTGATMGAQAAGTGGAVAGFVFGPALDAAIESGFTTRLKTAQTMANLAKAIRAGDVSYVNALASQLEAWGKRGRNLSQVGRTTATSPNESRPDTTLVPQPSR